MELKKQMPMPSRNGLIVIDTKTGKRGRTFHHIPHTKDGHVRVYLERTPMQMDWGEDATLVHRDHIKFVDFLRG